MNNIIQDNYFNNLTSDHLFATGVYRYHAPEFLDNVKPVFYDYVNQSKLLYGLDEIYPAIMTDSMIGENKIKDFEKFIADISWEVLKQQGYNVDTFYTQVHSMFGQSHNKMSGMEQHTHSAESCLSGMYFIDTPLDSCNLLFHDPRTVKYSSNLEEADASKVTLATNIINFQPAPGNLFICNSWLAHSLTRNRVNKPYSFIHFTIITVKANTTVLSPVIV